MKKRREQLVPTTADGKHGESKWSSKKVTSLGHVTSARTNLEHVEGCDWRMEGPAKRCYPNDQDGRLGPAVGVNRACHCHLVGGHPLDHFNHPNCTAPGPANPAVNRGGVGRRQQNMVAVGAPCVIQVGKP
jgi:hypothetical protein